jgi:membrane-bound ClpP family serine protease
LILGIIQTANTILEAFILIIIIIAILGIALTLALHSATKGRLSKTLVLNDSLKKESGYIGTEDLNYFLNREGTTLTVLKPSGIVDFDGVKLDVVSESEFLPKGTKVRVIKVSGRRIVVRKIEDN